MADHLLTKLANIPNTLSQQVSNGTSRAAKRKPRDLVNSLNKAAKDALKVDRPGGGWAEAATVDRVTEYARPPVAGYVVGAGIGHLYEQSAKYLFGRGLRTSDSPQADRRTFAEGAHVETRAKFKNPSHPVATAEERAARFSNNMHALKQEGALGLLVRAAASHAGTLIGTALYEDKAKVSALKNKFVTGANVTNAGLRTLLVSVPTVAAIGTGVAVGTGVSGLLAACALTKAGLQQVARGVGQWRAARTARAEAKSKNKNKNKERSASTIASPASTSASPASTPDLPDDLPSRASSAASFHSAPSRAFSSTDAIGFDTAAPAPAESTGGLSRPEVAEKGVTFEHVQAQISAMVHASNQDGNVLDLNDVATLRDALEQTKPATGENASKRAAYTSLMGMLHELDGQDA